MSKRPSPEQAARKDARNALRAALARLEIPECGCDAKLKPCCVRHGGCEERQETGDCDCPYAMPRPCVHIQDADHELPIDRWEELLAQAYPDEYLDPPTPDAPLIALDQETRAAAMMLRATNGRHLYHPGDVNELAGLGVTVTLTANKRPRPSELHIGGAVSDA